MATSVLENGKSKYVWKFFRAGGLDQVKIESGADLLALEKLDQKLWVALSCPTRGLEFDSKTLDAIDTDKDGRIRVPEVLAAVRWATGVLKSADELMKGGDAIELQSINEQAEGGKRLVDAVRLVLANLGKPDATSISLADFSDPARIYAKAQFNGDGVVLAESTMDPEIKQVVVEIIAALGGVPDRSGVIGVSQAKVDQFFSELQAYSDWWGKALNPPEGTAVVLTLGPATLPAWDIVKAVRAKIDDYFARCRVVAFDPRAANPLNRAEAEFIAMSSKSMATYCDEFVSFPLARIEASRPLSLISGLNPAWSNAIERFCIDVVVPVFGEDKTVLSEADWVALLQRFAACEAWLAAKQGAIVEKLGLSRVRQILAGKSRDVLSKTIALDMSVAPAMAEIANVEKLLRYHRDLVRLLNNFVSFSHFYALDGKAIFQAGTLYMDGRACHLCVKVLDAAAHAPVADLGKTYLAYCEVSRPAPSEKMVIAAAFTGGDSDQLRVGRNGVFYDCLGRDWDAKVIKTIEHPISIRQAFWSPYKRMARMFNEQIEKFASSRDQAVMEKASTSIESTTKLPATGKPPEKGKIDTGTLAAIGIIMAGLASAASNVFAGFLKLAESAWWKIPLVFVGIILAISGPSMVIAWLKLRKRDLGPILDGCGWAINGRVKLNMALGRVLTELAVVPGTAIRSLEDLYPEDPPKVPRLVWIVGAMIAIVIILEVSGIFAFLGIDELTRSVVGHFVHLEAR